MSKLLYDHKRMELYDDAEGEAFLEMGCDSVIVVAFTKEQEVLFVRTTSIAYQMDMLSLPMGGVDGVEFPVIAAKRELQEETGYRAGNFEYIGTLRPSIKYIRWECHVFVACELAVAHLGREVMPPIQVKSIPIRVVSRLISSGQLSDSTAIAALHLVGQHMKLASRVNSTTAASIAAGCSQAFERPAATPMSSDR